MNDVFNPFKSPAILSLCTGMRGLERGLERAIGELRAVAYVETEAVVCENLVQQMECGVLAPALVHTNVKTFKGDILRNKIHGVIGGYPCVGESAAGEMLGQDDPRYLWPDFKRIIQAARPVWGWFENVANHLNESFPYVLADLRHLGYSVEAGIFSAAEVGANHIRERLFILAIQNEFLLHTQLSRLEGHSGDEAEKRRTQRRQEQARSDVTPSVFPAFRGHPQYDWEAPRIESRMGLTVHRYDYTEDLLRLSGNGVVEQQAELAFRTLIAKHGVEI